MICGHPASPVGGAPGKPQVDAVWSRALRCYFFFALDGPKISTASFCHFVKSRL